MATSESHNSLQKPGKNFAWATIEPIQQGGVCHALSCLILEGKELISRIVELMEKDIFNSMRNTEQVKKQHILFI